MKLHMQRLRSHIISWVLWFGYRDGYRIGLREGYEDGHRSGYKDGYKAFVKRTRGSASVYKD